MSRPIARLAAVPAVGAAEAKAGMMRTARWGKALTRGLRSCCRYSEVRLAGPQRSRGFPLPYAPSASGVQAAARLAEPAGGDSWQLLVTARRAVGPGVWRPVCGSSAVKGLPLNCR